MKGVYQVKKERLKQLHGKENNIVRHFQFFSIRHCTNVNKISCDLLCGAMPIQYSSVKDELVLYGAMPIQDSSLKDELILRCSPSKFSDEYCKIYLICVCFFTYKCVIFNDHVFFSIIYQVCSHHVGTVE